MNVFYVIPFDIKFLQILHSNKKMNYLCMSNLSLSVYTSNSYNMAIGMTKSKEEGELIVYAPDG